MTYWSDMANGWAVARVLLLLANGFLSFQTQIQAQARTEDRSDANATVHSGTAACPLVAASASVLPLHGRPGKEGFPEAAAWNSVKPVVFCTDWRGQDAGPGRKTEVQILWSRTALYLRFQAQYKDLYLYPGKNQRQDKLWLRDVAEVFFQPPSKQEGYKEFEISPNGNWLAVHIFSAAEERFSKLDCDLRSRGNVDKMEHTWTAEIAIPMNCLTEQFEPATSWKVNFFRIEGAKPDRFYSAWHPTNTARPDFHVPEVFGELKFASE